MRRSINRCTRSLPVLLPLLLAQSTFSQAVTQPTSQGSPGTREVTIQRSDERALVFEFRPEFRPPVEIPHDGQRFILYDFSGSVQNDGQEKFGSPDVRYRSFPIALPGPEGNTVRVIAADYEDIPSVELAPIPTMRMRDSILEVGSYTPNGVAYASTTFQPVSIVEFVPAGASRSLVLASVRVYPLQYNASARLLRKYSRIVVEVNYGQRTTKPVANGDEAPFGRSLLNHLMVTSWKLPASRRVIKPSVLASGAWYRIPITEDGVYRLTAQYLSSAGIDLGGLDPRTIRIYGNGGTEVPQDIRTARTEDLVENAIHVEGGADGRFDPGDFVLFYGRSPRSWSYDPTRRSFAHAINHYSEVNYYWLTVGGAAGKRMAVQPSLNTTGAFVPDRFRETVALEKESENIVASGKDWLGQRIEPNSSYTLVTQLPGLVPDDWILYRYRLVASSGTLPRFTVAEKASNTALGSYSVGSSDEYQKGTGGQWQASGPSSLAGGSSQMNITFQTASLDARSWIDWVEIIYPRSFTAVGNVLHFRAPDTSATVEYRLQLFTEPPWIFEITSFADVRLVSEVGNSYVFQASEVAGEPSEYLAASPGAWKLPAAAQAMPGQDLRGFSAGAQFIIITSPEFRPAADRLAAFRRSQGISTTVVDVNQIYNEFAGGLPDITAIRDYLYYAYRNWADQPRYVLLFGQASFDYKGLLGSRSSYVPTWQSSESLNEVQSYSTDDFFARFSVGTALSLVVGRIPSRTSAEAEVVVDKIIRYDRNSVRDNWKLRIMFVGDDGWQPTRGDYEGTRHSLDIEELAEKYVPSLFEKTKVYIAEYPTEFAAQGRRKPGAFQAIIDGINRGELLFNYAGHGNPGQLADENIFNVQSSIPQLKNSDRLTVFFMATCNFSQFDDPQNPSGGERLMNKPDGGAVAVMATTRKVYAPDNLALARGMYHYLFQPGAFGQLAVARPAEALFLFKATTNSVNDQKFFFMGDPTMRLQVPTGNVSIDSIDEQPLDSLNGTPVTTPVVIRALSRVSVTGSIRTPGNAVDDSFDGELTLQVNDPTRVKTIVNFPPGKNWSYRTMGGMIFRGESSVRNGRFRASFVVPRDVFLADSLSCGRMLVYFSNDLVDGAGVSEKFRIGPPASTSPGDREGPKITVYLDSRGFRPGDMVSEKPTLIIDLADSSGINTSNSGIGHRIELWINDGSQSQDVTDFYTSNMDSYSEGSVLFQLKDIPQGRNTLRVRAWDSFNNSSTDETFFDVASSDHLTLSDVLNYPNPCSGPTAFTFRQNQRGLLNVTVKVYSVAGRLIQTLTMLASGESFVRVPWDGRDRDGDILANGVYFYKVLVSTADGRFSSEAIGKMSIVR